MDAETYGDNLPENMDDDSLPLSVGELVLQIEARFGYAAPVNPALFSDASVYAIRMAYLEGQRSVSDYLDRIGKHRIPMED